MKQLAALLVVSFLLASGCGARDDTCKNYAAMEWKCGDFPESEKAMTLKLAEGMCAEARGSNKKDDFSEMFRRDAECARKAKDCAAYTACKDATSDSE